MFAVRAGARVAAVWALLGLFALGVLLFLGMPLGARSAAADETPPAATAADETPPAATAAPDSDPTPQADAAPVGGAPAPAPAAAVDSLVAAPAVQDTSKAPETQAKDASPGEETENATTQPSEKLPETPLVPSALAKPIETPAAKPPAVAPSQSKAGGAAVKPRARVGGRAIAGRGAKVAPRNRALAKSPATKTHANGAPSKSGIPHEGLSEADRVASELERTERFVGRAQRSIVQSKNTRAMKLYTSALDFQSDSREACKVRQYARAERLTLAARDFADRASRMVGPPREDPNYVEHVLKRTDDAIERAKDVLRTGASRYAWRRHEDLKQEQKEAWRIFKVGDVGSAYKQTLGVREGVLALLRQQQDLPVPREAAEKAIGGAQAALDQANRELGPRPNVEAVRLVRLANEYLAKARHSFNRGSYRTALLQAKVVERHVEHAVDVGRPRS
jgi:hypothetical protein